MPILDWSRVKFSSRPFPDPEISIGSALLAAMLVIGLWTAPRYGVSIDEFNTDDYGPKALAWYTSGFTDRSHFETVEFSLWYYGPWFHILTALVQSLELGERFAVRHAMTFVVGWAGIAALLPLGRLVAGRWAGLAAVILSLGTGYLYGSLFFTTIDVPFLATMTWATLAITVAIRPILPSWRATIVTGLAIGLAIGTRTGGLMALAYLGFALGLCAVEKRVRNGRLPRDYIIALGYRFLGSAAVAVALAIAIWPWLQIGNPFRQFAIAFRHFGSIPMSYEFSHWGERARTDNLPLAYVPEQLAARLPEVFLLLLALAAAFGVIGALRLGRTFADKGALPFSTDVTRRLRGLLVVLVAAMMPIVLVMILRTTIYDGIRHLLFVIPMLAIIAGAAGAATLPALRRFGLLLPVLFGAYAGATILTLVRLHPLEYVAMNVFAGGTAGAYGRFELDYSSVAAGEALRRLEHRLDQAPPGPTPLRIMVCIPWREGAVAPLLKTGWIVATDANAADYVIETERWRCAAGRGLRLIEEVKRAGRSFSWVHARPVLERSQR
jgi:predicted outer membrane lipoprotein